MLAALALAVVYGQDNAAEQESTQDQLVKHLAGVFMTKEGGNMDAAQNSMRVFQVLSLHTTRMHLSFAQMEVTQKPTLSSGSHSTVSVLNPCSPCELMERYRLATSQNTMTGSLYNLYPSTDQILAYYRVPN